ncbi:MAG: hypothetical protein RMM30_03415 [Armatimonadota bacterium]|nr:hypothetical protein [Armatimonadota bacterium]MDW8155617.1 hypothetical protein [Armatimonadota bacterium]
MRKWAGWFPEPHADTAAMRAVLAGLWAARTFGRRVRVCVHPPEVAAVLSRQAPVQDRHVPWFVQVRALTHAYRQVEFLPAGSAEVDLVRQVCAGQGATSYTSGSLELVSR